MARRRRRPGRRCTTRSRRRRLGAAARRGGGRARRRPERRADHATARLSGEPRGCAAGPSRDRHRERRTRRACSDARSNPCADEQGCVDAGPDAVRPRRRHRPRSRRRRRRRARRRREPRQRSPRLPRGARPRRRLRRRPLGRSRAGGDHAARDGREARRASSDDSACWGRPRRRGAAQTSRTCKFAGLDFPYPGYLDNIVRQVALRFSPPNRARPLAADVSFLIHRDGSVTDVRLVRRSGSYDVRRRGAGRDRGRQPARAFGPLPRGFAGDVAAGDVQFRSAGTSVDATIDYDARDRRRVPDGPGCGAARGAGRHDAAPWRRRAPELRRRVEARRDRAAGARRGRGLDPR